MKNYCLIIKKSLFVEKKLNQTHPISFVHLLVLHGRGAHGGSIMLQKISSSHCSLASQWMRSHCECDEISN